ncbi:subtilisin-like protease SBT5.3 isoform X1 [Coffea arabica]|uniref:Subtilisin-like protease SBT5.3 isoform X1 n=1 Tax=Coffea arabica TaxID=13443 RepID=A0ABM4UCU8_COFAR
MRKQEIPITCFLDHSWEEHPDVLSVFLTNQESYTQPGHGTFLDLNMMAKSGHHGLKPDLVKTPSLPTLTPPYIVYLGSHSRDQNVEVSAVEYDRTRESHYSLLGSFLGSSEKAKDAIFYSYTRHINGFAAILDEAEAAEISKHPDVLSVFLSEQIKLYTTRSWEFLGLEQNGQIQPSWAQARFGEDTIIANIDSGVWPESESFSDEGYGPIPARWRGICQNENDSTFKCNRKLIGARYFSEGFFSMLTPNANRSVFNSPRDVAGHGTHTLSTAGGNFVAGANLFGLGNGTAKGGSPRARVAAYRACQGEGCQMADILAAFDMAIDDGVDVISLSVGGGIISDYTRGIAIASLHAVKRGIVVVAAAGNDGPNPDTLDNDAPWQITVGASTMDRQFPSYLVLGNNLRIRGESFSDKVLPNNTFFPIVPARSVKAANASDLDADICKDGALDPTLAKGKILVCLRGGGIGRLDKGVTAAMAGAVGLVLADYKGLDEVISDAHVLPALEISYDDAEAVNAYINSTRNPTAYITPPTTELGIKPAPAVARFSGRGPAGVAQDILKPDIIAPGVSVIAAYTEAHGPASDGYGFDKRRVPYFAQTGTSMACPHVAGVVGLLKTLHPDWSPAAIKSAIMTTARTQDNTGKPITVSDDQLHPKGTPFAYGAGHILPSRAMDPGLVYDLTDQDYFTFLCSMGYNQSQFAFLVNASATCPPPIKLYNFNYPAIAVQNFNDSVTVTRTVKNVGSSPATYTVHVRNPAGLSVDVQPKTLAFATIGEQKSFNVTITATKAGAAREYVFGSFTWLDGKHSVRSHIAVKAFCTKCPPY